MAEEAATPDVNSEINIDLFAEAEPTAPSEPEKESSTEEAKPQAEANAEEPAEGTETEAPDEKVEDAKSEETAEEPETETEQPKESRSQERIRTLANENRELRSRLEQVYRAQTPEEIAQAALEQGNDLDPAMAEIQAMRQEREVERYTNHVVSTTTAVESSAQEVMRDFPMFNPESDQYDKALAERVQTVYTQVAGIQQDPQTGLISSINVLPYDIYKAFAESHGASVQAGEVKGQKATEKMIARTDAPSAAAPKPQKVDPLLQLWKD